MGIEFLSKSNTASEMMEKLEFYSDFGCEEFYIYDYQRGTFRAFRRHSGGDGLLKDSAESAGTWISPLLDMTFGLSDAGKLWVRRPDGKLMESQRQLATRAEVESNRAAAFAKKLRELGVDPDAIA